MSENEGTEWEAAQWVARRMGDAPFDQQRFDAWLAGDPRRKPLFDTMWQHVMGPRMDAALGAYVRKRQSRRTLIAGSAAALLALAGGYAALPLIGQLTAQPQEYGVPDGSVRAITLADGTRLTLAGGAAVRVRYSGYRREIELVRGTVFADVVHDAARPFRISAGDARITDLGTRFEVSKKPASVRVTVESGSVGFGTSGWFAKHISLTADQAALLSDAGLERKDGPGRNGVARWRSQWVEYHDTPMRQVVADLESVSPLPIRIADPALATLRVSGRIRLTDPAGQIGNLAIIHNFTVDRRDGVILLAAGNKGS